MSRLLILDLDGVLITTPSWKNDCIHEDGYSDFNVECVTNLNILVATFDFELWLISSRRKGKAIEEFNVIFSNRGIGIKIAGYVPMYHKRMSRREELEQFLILGNYDDFVIIDDDKSLNGLPAKWKQRLVSTETMIGFNKDKLQETIAIIESL